MNTRLRELLSHISEAGILLTIDEVQDASVEDLTTIAVTYQDLLRDDLNVAIVAAGLPQGINRLLDLPGVTFLRRAQKFILGPLSPDNTAQAFSATARGSGIEFTDAATEEAVWLSGGYPYLVQLVGSLAWSRAATEQSHHVEKRHVISISHEAITTLVNQVHRPATIGLPPAQRQFLAAIAAVFAHGSASIADIAEHEHRTVKSLSATRQQLIDADLIEPIRHSGLQFVIPYMEELFTSAAPLGRVD